MQVQIIFSTFLTLVSMWMSGGPRDLLGYLSTDSYWRAQGVHISVESLSKDLPEPAAVDVAKLIEDLSAADPKVRESAGQKIVQAGPGALPQLRAAMNDPNPETSSRARNLTAKIRDVSQAASIRRLMAIRTLGEMKNPAALPLLRPLLKSPAPFVHEYAQAAIARIENRPPAPIGFSQKQRETDVGLMPAKVDMVGQIAPTGAIDVLPIDRIIERLPLGASLAQKGNAIDKATAQIIELADSIGNIRIDCVTFGWFTGPVNQPGNAVFIGRGQYDSGAAIDALRKSGLERKTVGGMEVFMLDEDTALLLPDDRTAVLIPAETNGEVPIARTVAALKKGAGDLAVNVDLSKIVQSIDTKQPFWIATKVNDGLRQVIEILAPFQTVAIVGRAAAPDKVAIQLDAIGSDPNAAKAAISETVAGVQQMIQQAKEEQKLVAMIGPAVQFLQSVQVESNGASGTLKCEITGDQILSFLLQWKQSRFGADVNVQFPR